ncbi:MAG: hypothetical protein AAFY56_08880 [Pseudomonadota bacterium]
MPGYYRDYSKETDQAAGAGESDANDKSDLTQEDLFIFGDAAKSSEETRDDVEGLLKFVQDQTEVFLGFLDLTENAVPQPGGPTFDISFPEPVAESQSVSLADIG